jgi:hypothetical protein
MLNIDLYRSLFFVVGVLVVITFAWQRFNEPSFPNRKTLPRTLFPVRYLFLRSSYQRARLTYVGAMLLVYCILVPLGPKVAPFLSTLNTKEFPPEGWALLAALIWTGVGRVPDSFRWLNKIEDQLRQWVHEWFLVPDGVERTVGILEDAPYELPASQLNLVEIQDKETLQQDLKSAAGTLLYRWGRATALITSSRKARSKEQAWSLSRRISRSFSRSIKRCGRMLRRCAAIMSARRSSPSRLRICSDKYTPI